MAVVAAVTTSVFKDSLNIKTAIDDGDLQRLAVAATIAAEKYRGPLIIRSFTDRVRSDGHLLLRRTPVVAVQSVASVNGWSVTVGELDVDGTLGLVHRFGGFPSGYYAVTYTAGAFATVADVTEDVTEAVCIIGKQLWEARRGQGARPMVDGSAGYTPMGFAVPARAVELLTASGDGPVFCA